MIAYLGLGANLGEREKTLRRAAALKAAEQRTRFNFSIM